MIGKILHAARVNHNEVSDQIKTRYEDTRSNIEEIQAKVDAIQKKVDQKFDLIQEEIVTSNANLKSELIEAFTNLIDRKLIKE